MAVTLYFIVSPAVISIGARGPTGAADAVEEASSGRSRRDEGGKRREKGVGFSLPRATLPKSGQGKSKQCIFAAACPAWRSPAPVWPGKPVTWRSRPATLYGHKM